MLRGEATDTNSIVFGLTRPELEPTIYRTRGEHANYYATDAVEENKRDMKQVQKSYLLLLLCIVEVSYTQCNVSFLLLFLTWLQKKNNIFFSLCLNFFHLLVRKPKAKFRKCFLFIQKNSFIIFTCLNPVLLVPAFAASGLA